VLLVAVVLALTVLEEVELELTEGVALVVGAGEVAGAVELLPDPCECEEP
jgi:hypothetical protein